VPCEGSAPSPESEGGVLGGSAGSGTRFAVISKAWRTNAASSYVSDVWNRSRPCRYFGKFLFQKIGLLQDMGFEFISQTRQLQFHTAALRYFTKGRCNQPNLSGFVGDRIKIHQPAAGFRAAGNSAVISKFDKEFPVDHTRRKASSSSGAPTANTSCSCLPVGPL